VTHRGRVAVVTGGQSGIGKAIAARLASAGARVSVLDLTGGAPHDSVPSYQVDVGDERAVDAAFDAVASREGRIDYLICCAAIFPASPFLELSAADWERTVRVNLTGSFLCCRAAGPHMIRQKKGVILNISSIAGEYGSTAMPHYAAANAGVLNFTRTLALAWAQHGIRVNALAPGPIVTEAYENVLRAGGGGEEAFQRVANAVAMRRWGKPEEVAFPALFLVSEAASYITGATLLVDGGPPPRH